MFVLVFILRYAFYVHNCSMHYTQLRRTRHFR